MKLIILVTFGALFFAQMVFGQIASPTGDYLRSISENKAKGFVETETNETIYKWTADVNGDGREFVFLTLKDFYESARHDGQMPQWAVYLPKADGSGYLNAPNNEAQIDQEKMYVGQITQLGKRGIVTVQIDRPSKKAAVANLYAYTIEGDHLKRTKLAQYNPDEDSNAIYNQYLKDDKRTRVALQEIKP